MSASADHTYAVVAVDHVNKTTESSGLSHVEAMRLAERAQREGKVARIIHVVGANRYEVDSYPPR